MELSDRALQVLRNFSGINGNIFIEEGNVVRTVSESRTVLAKSTLDVEFPQSLGIYDLREFLSVLGLVEKPMLGFNEKYVDIVGSTGRSKIKYFYSDPSTLTTVNKDLALPSVDAWFTLDSSTFSKIKSAASALGHQEVNVTIDNGVVMLTTKDNDDDTSNAFSVAVDGESESDNLKAVFNINNLKMVEDGEYRVSLSSKYISHFVNTESNSEYWVALQKSSNF
jgi:hypothetical protein